MSVGLEPTWGRAQAESSIAADINRDGLVSAADALDVPRIAVGLPGCPDAEWVFLDANAGLSEIALNNTGYETGMTMKTQGGLFQLI
ncbi:hypothetical protein [Ruegeria atlantica]|uniref:hypothetical protein n=1 Tax=Ruegeria atlantica TaxID=81569 RepID=UPI00147E9E4F|nr:hypothetical protein [Ruegeria atlantica]